MDPSTELEYLRERVDTQTTQNETLQEHLDEARVEIARLTALCARLERVCDERQAEIARLTQVVGSNY